MANLTQQDFLSIAAQNPAQINLWCTTGSIATILGLTVPTLDNSVPPANVEETLRQVEVIYLPVDDGPGEVVGLQVDTRTRITAGASTYFFFTVVPQDITQYTEGTNEALGDSTVIFTPGISGELFTNTDYNVIGNNVEINRQSTYLTLVGSSTLAQVQDSSYSNTGWINARYDGSITNATTYTGLEAVISGKSFAGTIYSSELEDSTINLQDTTERTYQTFFHTGNKDYPQYTTASQGYYMVSNNQGTQSTIEVLYSLGSTPLAPGEILRVYSNSVSPTEELVKVVNTVNQVGTLKYDVTLIRGWDETPIQNMIGTDYRLFRIENNILYRLDRNKAIKLGRSKLRIKDTGDIMYIDQLGQVVSASIYTPA